MPSVQRFLTAFERAERELVSGVVDAESQSLGYADGLAVKYSSGTETDESLAEADHPYATRHGAPQLDPTIINTHKPDGFIAQWRTLAPTFMNGALQSVLLNFSRVADFLQAGTRKMFARPIDVRVATEMEPIRIRNIQSAVDRALRLFR